MLFDIAELTVLLQIAASAVSQWCAAKASLTSTLIGCPILFTAPHGIWLHRDDNEVPRRHRSCPPPARESIFDFVCVVGPQAGGYTSFLAKDLALQCGGSVATWCPEEVTKSKETGEADDDNRDPNYSHPEELSSDPWYHVLLDHAARCGSLMGHVDVHGEWVATPCYASLSH